MATALLSKAVTRAVLKTHGSLSVIAQRTRKTGVGALDTVRRLDDARDLRNAHRPA
jgi:hypothetical protein